MMIRTTCPNCDGREVDLSTEAILLILDPAGVEVPASQF
jgi:hypothetical protein